MEYAEKLSPKLDAGIFLSVFRSLSARNKKDYGSTQDPLSPKKERKDRRSYDCFHPSAELYSLARLFYKAAHSDVFVYLDDAQFSSDAAHNYNMIKTPLGGLRLKSPWIILSVIPSPRPYQRRTRLEKKALKTLEANYARAPYFTELFPGFSEVLNCDYESIAALNMAVNGFFGGVWNCDAVIASSGMALENRVSSG